MARSKREGVAARRLHRQARFGRMLAGMADVAPFVASPNGVAPFSKKLFRGLVGDRKPSCLHRFRRGPANPIADFVADARTV